MAHFYLDETLAPTLPTAVAGDIVALTGPDARHAVTVARLRAGERLSIGDGAGMIATGVVVEAGPARVALRLETADAHPAPSPRLTLVQALAKGDRDELAVQAATELGVDAVVPWQAARSIARWSGPKAEKGRARWQAIVREASKQAIRPRVPEVAGIVSTRELARMVSAHSGTPTGGDSGERASDGDSREGEMALRRRVLVLDPIGDVPLAALDPATLRDVDELVLIVGPEGGIADEEFALFAAVGATRVRLGPTVLRTSTAGPAAIAVLSGLLGRW